MISLVLFRYIEIARSLPNLTRYRANVRYLASEHFPASPHRTHLCKLPHNPLVPNVKSFEFFNPFQYRNGVVLTASIALLIQWNSQFVV